MVTGDPDGSLFAYPYDYGDTGFNHTYSSPDLYYFSVNMSNAVRWASHTLIQSSKCSLTDILTCCGLSWQEVTPYVAVEVIINGFSMSVDPIKFGDVGIVNVSLTTGTRVNFTCTFDGQPCEDWTISWENLMGKFKDFKHCVVPCLSFPFLCLSILTQESFSLTLEETRRPYDNVNCLLACFICCYSFPVH